MRNQTCCFTGHRNIPPNQRENVIRRLKEAVEISIRHGYSFFCAGGALGFDTLAAQAALDLKEEYPHIQLILVLPCKTQTRGWNQEDIKQYEKIKAFADKVIYTAENYYNGCMHKRNRCLVDHSSLCICYLRQNTGGTYYTVNYAADRGLKIINIAERE